MQYKQSRKGLKEMLDRLGNTEQDELDKMQINSMINSVSKIIDWLETGRNPYFQQGVDIRYIYQIKSFDERFDSLQTIPDILDAVEEPFEITDDQKNTLVEIFKLLSDRERECFLLHIGQGWSMQEIADELNISKSTVQTHVERAKEKIEELNRDVVR